MGRIAYASPHEARATLRPRTMRRRESCEVCCMQFDNKSLLMMHSGEMHCDRELNKRLCTVCYLMFENQIDYELHMLRHNGKRSHRCHKCGRPFVDRKTLFKHGITHNDERWRNKIAVIPITEKNNDEESESAYQTHYKIQFLEETLAVTLDKDSNEKELPLDRQIVTEIILPPDYHVADL